MRKPLLVWILVLCLAYLSLGGLSGGYLLIKDPSGATLGLPPVYLELLPVSNFFLAGLFLFVVFGLIPIVEIFAIFSHRHWAGRLAFWLGIVLVGWMLLQIVWIGYQVPIQAIMLAIGLVLSLLPLHPRVQGYFSQPY